MDDDFISFTQFLDDVDYEEPSSSSQAPETTMGQPQLYTKGRKRTLDEMQYETGYSKRQRIAAESRVAPWTALVNWDDYSTAADMLNREVEAFVQYISPTPEEHETRLMVVEWIRRVIVAEFPDAELVPFGSFATKLYLPTGDIDLVVKSSTIGHRADLKSTLFRLASILRKANITSNVEVLAKTKVPIVKFTTSHGSYKVDISVNQMNGIGAVDIVNQFVEELPALKPLLLVIKSFLSQRSMNEVFTGGVGSYSIVCLVVSFLQMHPKIRRCSIDPMQNLGVLLVEFFETYGRFFYFDVVGISIRSGGHYFRKKDRLWAGGAGLLTIEDPQDPSNDISSGSYGFIRVKQTLQGAFEVLSAALCLRGSELLDPSKEAQREFDARSPDELSLLGSIMGITPQTVSQRRLTTQLYKNGVLHRLLDLPFPSSLPNNTVHASKSHQVSTSRRSRSRSPRQNGDHAHYRSRNQSPLRSSQNQSRSSRNRDPAHERSRRYGHEYQEGEDPHLAQDYNDERWDEASRGAREAQLSNMASSHASSLSSPHHRRRSSRADTESGEDAGRYGISTFHTKLKHRTAKEAARIIYVNSTDESDDNSASFQGTYASAGNAKHHDEDEELVVSLASPPSHNTVPREADTTGKLSQKSRKRRPKKSADKRAYWSGKAGVASPGGSREHFD